MAEMNSTAARRTMGAVRLVSADYPRTKKEDFVELLGGRQVQDPYRWLEDGKDPAVLRWINAQNRYAKGIIGKIRIRDNLEERFSKYQDAVGDLGSLEPSSELLPSGEQRYFQFRYPAEDTAGSVCYKNGPNGEWKKAIDTSTFDAGVDFDRYFPNRDGTMVVFTTSRGGSDIVDVHLCDLITGKTTKNVLKGIRYYEMAWLKDGTGFYYCNWADPNTEKGAIKADKVFLHMLGTKQAEDVPIFGKGIEAEAIFYVNVSKDGKYLIITAEKTDSASEYYKKIGSKSEVKPLILCNGEESYVVDIINDTVYARTSVDAPRFRLVSFNLNNNSKENWTTLIAEDQAVLQNACVVNNKIITHYLDGACSDIKVFSVSGKLLGKAELPFLGIVNSSEIVEATDNVRADAKGRYAFFTFESLINSTGSYRINLGNYKVDKIEQAGYGLSNDSVQLERTFYESKDGTKVQMLMLHKKGIKLNRKNPVMLTCYGGFGLPNTPSFDPSIIPFVEDGGIYVIAGVRGGGECGKGWHDQGVRRNKQNTIDDFIYAAKWLIENKYTNSEKMAAYGSSNGGTVVLAGMLQRPDLFKIVVGDAPLTDMARYHKFGGGAEWLDEYGNPANDGDLKSLLDYSPYHNVNYGQKYPSVLIIAGQNDTRADAMHTRKFAAKMQEYNASNNRTLLLTDMNSGHDTFSGKDAYIGLMADQWALIYNELNMMPAAMSAPLQQLKRAR